ncbi:hypothetical protein Avbf_14036 [Armadillidium vulgare]|nr:hypothetical protein Avbf_14036 [Armadillidium vulgare]
MNMGAINHHTHLYSVCSSNLLELNIMSKASLNYMGEKEQYLYLYKCVLEYCENQEKWTVRPRVVCESCAQHQRIFSRRVPRQSTFRRSGNKTETTGIKCQRKEKRKVLPVVTSEAAYSFSTSKLAFMEELNALTFPQHFQLLNVES